MQHFPYLNIGQIFMLRFSLDLLSERKLRNGQLKTKVVDKDERVRRNYKREKLRSFFLWKLWMWICIDCYIGFIFVWHDFLSNRSWTELNVGWFFIWRSSLIVIRSDGLLIVFVRLCWLFLHVQFILIILKFILNSKC